MRLPASNQRDIGSNQAGDAALHHRILAIVYASKLPPNFCSGSSHSLEGIIVKNLVSYFSFILFLGLSAVILVSTGHAEGTGLPGGNVTAASETDEDAANLAPGSAPLINPEDLVKILQSPKAEKPLILTIGPRALFLQAHIPSSEYIGLSAESQGMEALLARVKPLPHNKFIVLYCGCCPWSHCPNVRPAYYQLHKAGFTRVKVLYIPDNLGTDWVYKGYPTVKGQ